MSIRSPERAVALPGCPSAETLAAHLAAVELTPNGAELIAHTESCAACQARVGQLLRDAQSLVEASIATHTHPAADLSDGQGLEPGLTFGDYVLIEPIGSGAIAQVFLARHPQLDRQVALKLIPLPRSAEARAHAVARAQREGRALARLNHPHVVTVHAVGEAHGYAYVAMELVRGGTLRQWAAAAPRATVRDAWALLGTLVQAGRGLAEAHRAGLVHRDFKPDNVLVSEAGVARVTDFGLARAIALAEQPPEAGPVLEEDSDAFTTRTGAVIGTPAYMAPEQLAGGSATALSDQFSFCVTAFECLYGERPFEPRAAGQPRTARGPLRKAPVKGPVPRAVYALLARGLSPQPEQRHPSLEALLDALEQLARPRSRRLLWASGAVGALAIAAAVALATAPGRREAALCEASTRWTGVWDPARRTQIEQAFASSGKSFSGPAFEQVSGWLDAYTRQWSDTQRQVCLASSVAHAADRTYEQLCLQQRRQDVSELVNALGRADHAMVSRVGDLSSVLVPASRCLLGPAPAGRPALDLQATPEEVEALQAVLARAKVADRAGEMAEAERLAREAVARAEAMHLDPLAAEAQLVLGRVLAELHQQAPAVAALFSGAIAAEGAGLYPIAAECWLELANANNERTSEVADRWLALAEVAVRRAGSPPDLQAELKAEQGFMLVNHGKFEGAVALQREAVELLTSRNGDQDPRAVTSNYHLGMSLGMLGRCGEAEPLLRSVIAARQRALSASHPETVDAVEALAICLQRSGRADESIALFKSVLQEREAQVGPGSPRFASALSNYAGALNDLGRYAEALESTRRALAIRTQVYGASDHRVARQVLNEGLVLMKLERHAEALESLRRARDVFEASPGSGPFEGAVARLNIAESLVKLGRDAAAWRELMPLDRLPADQLKLLSGPWLTTRGLVLLRLKRYHEAEQALARAAETPLNDLNTQDVLVRARALLAEARQKTSLSPVGERAGVRGQ